MIQPGQQRLIGIGTPEKMWVPTLGDLMLKDWDNSYLCWADLSGLELPPMVDADVIHYNAERTVFDDCTYTNFRYPLSLVDAVFPANWSGKATGRHDWVAEVIRRAITNPSMPRLPQQIAQSIYSYLGQNYGRSWTDTYYHGMVELRLTIEEAYQAYLPIFQGYPSQLARLRWHRDRKAIGIDPPDIETNLARVEIKMLREKQEFDLRTASNDRWAAARMAEQLVGDPRIRVWYGQLIPYGVLRHSSYMESPDYLIDLRRGWA